MIQALTRRVMRRLCLLTFLATSITAVAATHDQQVLFTEDAAEGLVRLAESGSPEAIVLARFSRSGEAASQQPALAARRNRILALIGTVDSSGRQRYAGLALMRFDARAGAKAYFPVLAQMSRAGDADTVGAALDGLQILGPAAIAQAPELADLLERLQRKEMPLRVTRPTAGARVMPDAMFADHIEVVRKGTIAAIVRTIGSMGPDASGYAPRFVDLLVKYPALYEPISDALEGMGGGVPVEVPRRLVALMLDRSRDAGVREAAAKTLCHSGPIAVGQIKQLVDVILNWREHPEFVAGGASCALRGLKAAVGPHAESLGLLLEGQGPGAFRIKGPVVAVLTAIGPSASSQAPRIVDLLMAGGVEVQVDDCVEALVAMGPTAVIVAPRLFALAEAPAGKQDLRLAALVALRGMGTALDAAYADRLMTLIARPGQANLAILAGRVLLSMRVDRIVYAKRLSDIILRPRQDEGLLIAALSTLASFDEAATERRETLTTLLGREQRDNVLVASLSVVLSLGEAGREFAPDVRALMTRPTASPAVRSNATLVLVSIGVPDAQQQVTRIVDTLVQPGQQETERLLASQILAESGFPAAGHAPRISAWVETLSPSEAKKYVDMLIAVNRGGSLPLLALRAKTKCIDEYAWMAWALAWQGPQPGPAGVLSLDGLYASDDVQRGNALRCAHIVSGIRHFNADLSLLTAPSLTGHSALSDGAAVARTLRFAATAFKEAKPAQVHAATSDALLARVIELARVGKFSVVQLADLEQAQRDVSTTSFGPRLAGLVDAISLRIRQLNASRS